MELKIDIKNGEIVKCKGFYFDNGDLVCYRNFEDRILNINYSTFKKKIEALIDFCDNVQYWNSRQTLYISNVNKLTETELKQAFACLVRTYKQMEQYLANVELVEKI